MIEERAPANQLSEDEVKRLLTSYDSEETTNELYSFGLEMVKEAADRYHRFDSKATKIAGYAGAVLALLVSQFSEWSTAVDWWAVPVVLGAAVLALVAAALGLAAISLREIQMYSPSEWINEPSLKNPSQLRRYHIYTMYGVRQSFIGECQWKARRVRYRKMPWDGKQK